jgi:hypothetical protein
MPDPIRDIPIGLIPDLFLDLTPNLLIRDLKMDLIPDLMPDLINAFHT